MLNRAQAKIVGGLLIILLVGLVVACSPAAAGSQADVPASGSEITVVGQGEAYGEPDLATVQVGVETFAEAVDEATSGNQATVDSIMSALEAVGIAPEDIQTTNYSLWAEQQPSEQGFSGIAGYRVTNQVNVTIRDIDKVGEVLAAATEAGANSIYGIQFSVDDPAALESEARADAMADARTRADDLAGLAGLEIGEVKVISEVIGQPVMPFMGGGGGFAMEAAASQPGISPGQMAVMVQVQVTFAAE